MDIPNGLRDGVRCEETSIRSFCESFIMIQLVLAVLDNILSCGWWWGVIIFKGVWYIVYWLEIHFFGGCSVFAVLSF